MSVQTVDYTMKVPKEGKEVMDLLNAILEKVMSKAPVIEFARLLDELRKAVDGIGGISEEMRSQYRDELAGYMVHKLMGTLLPPITPTT